MNTDGRRSMRRMMFPMTCQGLGDFGFIGVNLSSSVVTFDGLDGPADFMNRGQAYDDRGISAAY